MLVMDLENAHAIPQIDDLVKILFSLSAGMLDVKSRHSSEDHFIRSSGDLKDWKVCQWCLQNYLPTEDSIVFEQICVITIPFTLFFV